MEVLLWHGLCLAKTQVSALFALVSSVSFSTNSTTDGEQWSIFGSNVAHSYEKLKNICSRNERKTSATLPDFGTYKYYDFVYNHRERWQKLPHYSD